MLFRRAKPQKAYVFIDVDGTISPNQYPEGDYFCSDWNGCHYFSSKFREQLSLLPAEKIWLTNWEEDAEETFQCGWRTLTGNREQGDLWKYFALQQFIETHQVSKLVWLDDEIVKWQTSIPPFTVPTLKISPPSYLGLSEDDLLTVQDFLLNP